MRIRKTRLLQPVTEEYFINMYIYIYVKKNLLIKKYIQRYVTWITFNGLKYSVFEFKVVVPHALIETILKVPISALLEICNSRFLLSIVICYCCNHSFKLKRRKYQRCIQIKSYLTIIKIIPVDFTK